MIPVGWALDYTTASQGDTLYVLIGGGVMGGFAALHYWFPKLGGRLLGEGVGKVALVLMTIGVHLYVIPMFFAGLVGQPVDVFKFYEDTGLDGYNLVASIGAFILVIGIFVELGNAAYSWHSGLPARGHDPWGGTTLEWYALSPPPRTTSTRSRTSAAPSRCTTSANRSCGASGRSRPRRRSSRSPGRRRLSPSPGADRRRRRSRRGPDSDDGGSSSVA